MVLDFADHVCSIGLGRLGPRHLEEEKCDCPFRAGSTRSGTGRGDPEAEAENIVHCAKSGDLDSPSRVMTALR